jgi:hypothetical protein
MQPLHTVHTVGMCGVLRAEVSRLLGICRDTSVQEKFQFDLHFIFFYTCKDTSKFVR